MTPLQTWIIHRAKTVRLSWPTGVADAAGIAPSTLDSIASAGSLRHVGRGARGYIARALKVSVRELEAMEAGRIKWIADDRVVQFDRVSSAVARNDEMMVRQAYVCTPGTGVPILGRILEMGKVEHFDAWTSDDGPRLPVRFAGLPDAFALELMIDFAMYPARNSLVFQTIPPGEMRDGELLLMTHCAGGGNTEIGRVHRTMERDCCALSGVIGTHNERIIPLEEILRSARVVGSSKKELAMER